MLIRAGGPSRNHYVEFQPFFPNRTDELSVLVRQPSTIGNSCFHDALSMDRPMINELIEMRKLPRDNVMAFEAMSQTRERLMARNN